MLTTETKPLRDFSAFKGWNFRYAGVIHGTKQYFVWKEGRCENESCMQPLMLHAYYLTATEDELYASKLISAPSSPLQSAYIPFAGGPVHCAACYKAWLEGKILPSEVRI